MKSQSLLQPVSSQILPKSTGGHCWDSLAPNVVTPRSVHTWIFVIVHTWNQMPSLLIPGMLCVHCPGSLLLRLPEPEPPRVRSLQCVYVCVCWRPCVFLMVFLFGPWFCMFSITAPNVQSSLNPRLIISCRLSDGKSDQLWVKTKSFFLYLTHELVWIFDFANILPHADPASLQEVFELLWNKNDWRVIHAQV